MIRPRKSFGQHWLRCQQTLDRIIFSANLTDRDIVLEIGAGTGNLTARLLPLVQALIIVEIDRQLCTKLQQKFTDPKLHLIEGDILRTDLRSLPLAPHKVVANIPYNITGLILEKLLGTIAKPCTQWQSIVLLVQKEIADRLTAKPHDKHKAYGALSVRAQYLAHCEYICEVPASAFYPSPQVTSAVVRLTPRQPPLTADNPDRLDQLVRMGFANRRKMLHNNLSTVISKEALTAILATMNLSPLVRAEELSLEQWIHLANLLPSPSGRGAEGEGKSPKSGEP